MKKLSLLMISLLITLTTSAQNIRYVSTTGSYSNDGKSWDSPKLNIQDAINDLVNNKLTGEVWVAAGTYTPTESTESSGGSTLYMSFKIPQGITVRGGFAPGLTAAKDGVNDETTRPRLDYKTIGWFYQHHTILSGNLSSQAKFTWNNERQSWETSFYGNTYHVVWFATKGFDSEGRANPVNTDNPISTPESQMAVLEGCVVTGGNAHNNTVTGRTHNAYGGGIYMVAGSKVENCYVHNCEASRDGGGIYMDGGGYTSHVYVADCQALGIGVQNGYGGGIAVDGPSATASAERKGVKTYVARSGIAGCVGRMGGGLAYNTYDMAHKYNICASAVLVANNTATTEGGGIYVNRGAALTHVTVVNNRCNGTGITIGGMQTGRAGGIYVRDNAHIANSVIWGNKCASNQDIQYASSRSSSKDELKPTVQFTMLSKSDHSDWSGTVKYKVEKLSEYNNLAALTAAKATKGESEDFPMFNNPSPQAGYIANVGLQTIRDVGAGDANKAYDWQVNQRSSLTHRGVLTYDLDTEHITPAVPKTKDVLGNLFTARVTIGAYNSKPVSGLPYMYAEKNGVEYAYVFGDGHNRYEDEHGTEVEVDDTYKRVANLYVDPNEKEQEETATNSGSWDTPAKYLSDVLYYIKTWWHDDVPAHQALFAELDEINVYVKQGTVYNTSAHYEGHVRNSTIEIPHLTEKSKPIHLNIIGSMDTTLVGTDVSMRDPVRTPTVITGELLDDYEMNAAHLVTFSGCKNVVFDGFQIRYANAKSEKMENTNQNGAAMTFTHNGAQCDGVQVKNVLVAGCTAVNGAAVYITDGSLNISFENCIFHNNQVNYKSSQQANGIVYIGSGSTGISFDHCDILRNVGYAFENNGSMTITNSMVYANMSKVLEATSGQAAYGLAPFAVKGTVTGHHNLFDTKATDITALGDNTLSFNKDDANYPRFVNSTKNAGVSQKGDVTYFGRAASFEPTNVNPMVNAASYAGEHTTWGTDMSTNTTRDYGGLPDIGAIENHKAGSAEGGENANKDGQLAYGGAYYVRDYRDGSGNVDYTAGGDGSSWANAINGNAYYYPNGTHGASTTITITEGYNEYDTYQPRQGDATALPSTGTISVYMKNGSNYLYYTGSALATTTNINQASVFNITRSGNTGSNYTITVNYNNTKVNVGYTTSGNNRTISFSNASVWTSNGTAGSSTSANFYFTYRASGSNRTRYLNTDVTANISWSFYTVDTETIHHKDPITGTYDGVRGLQYAVNKAHDDFDHEGGTLAQKKLVYVGAGTYTNATGAAAGTTFTSAERDKHLLKQPYAYEIKEGVDVYGGFPGTGNPGMNERDPKKNKTILQPQSQSPYITFNRPTAGGGGYHVTVSNWGSCGHNTNGSEKVSVGRVLVQASNFNVETRWDGFTLRHGYLLTGYMNNIGSALTSKDAGKGLNPGEVMQASGAGALLQEKGLLSNCVITENLILCSPRASRMITMGPHIGTTVSAGTSNLYTYHMSGAGVFMSGTLDSKGLCNGKGAIVENCEVGKNQIVTKSQSTKPDHVWMYGGGIFQNGGQMYNTIIHDNDMITVEGGTSRYSTENSGSTYSNEMILGGVFIASGNFYNNTVVNNLATSLYSAHYNHCTFSGIHVFNNAHIYNSVICDNLSRWYYTGGTSPGNGVPVSAFEDDKADRASRDRTKVYVKYSFVDVAKNLTATDDKTDLVSYNDTQGNPTAVAPYNTNIYLNRSQTGAARTITSSAIYFKAGAAGTTSENVYHLKESSESINTGTDDIADVDIPDYDADYTNRIKDCAIDMGAYEYNGSYSITPHLVTVDGVEQAIYYVTPESNGLASGSDPANSACGNKLQQVLDAAGRYKFLNPGKQVIVKVANSKGLQKAESDFMYSATRTTNEADENARIWSIIVPHGVEVWGGYTDVPFDGEKEITGTWSNTNNGFYKMVDDKYVDLRNVTVNPTYFSGVFNNTVENTTAESYHVVAFSDRIYDAEGHPYMKKDYNSSAKTFAAKSSYDKDDETIVESDFMHMSDETTLINKDGKRDLHRAVIDGLFITGGNANGEETSPLNNCGGAAIVTDFAQVRNCIIEDNDAHNGGGLAVLQRGLVSGTLFLNNTAELGGAIYIVPNGTEIAPTLVGSWGSTTVEMVHIDDEGKILNWTDAPAGKSMGWNMSHIFTTTIVNNTATKQGGGIYYANDGDPNTRVNSTVIWNNDAPDMANVAGVVSPDKPEDNTASTLTFFPFGYSAIQNVRASGTNNIKVESEARRGVRWQDLDEDPWYGITDYSVLTRTGMPVGDYDAVVNHYNVATRDFAALDRKVAGSGSSARSFIDMGARAIDKKVLREQLMLRLFVAQEVDDDAMDAILDEINTNHSGDEEYTYYAQEGSSFAFPMQHLQDALDYIYWARSEKSAGVLNQEHANNLPFEIIVGKGTYFPTRDLQGNYGESTANTFLVPEGVSIIGGFDSMDNYTYDGEGNVTERKFYGRYNEFDEIKEPKGLGGATYYITDNVKKLGKTNSSPADYEPEDLVIDLGGGKKYTILHKSLDVMKAHRAKADINANNIIEPWEFLNETVLDGDAVNSTHARVYHVLTAFPDQSLVGMLPKRSIERFGIGGTYNPKNTGHQYYDREEGQSINLNGLTVQNGEAYNFIPGSLDEMSAYSYYHGGAMLIDGNRYLDNWNKTSEDNENRGDGWSTTGATRYMHMGVTNAVGYRDIPVAISQCKFVNNIAGYGGAISANTTIDIFNSSFEQNMAKSGTEDIKFNSSDYTISFPGQGGAVYSTHQFSAFNTIFANNEALDTMYQITPQEYLTLRTQDATKATAILGGTGGAIYSGRHGMFHLVNCNLVRNMANAYPAVFTMNPNYADQRTQTISTPEYNQMVNCIIWGNEVNKEMAAKWGSNPYFKFASRLISNHGKLGRGGQDYDPRFIEDEAPLNQSDLDTRFEETVWFSAYEDGRGFTQDNTKDFRSAEYRPFIHAKLQLSMYDPTGKKYGDAGFNPYDYQNCNISLDPSNASLEGPNFISPSVEAGYAGYMESADWSPARLNKMTDMGSGKIKQIITVDGERYTSVFPKYNEQDDVTLNKDGDPYTDPLGGRWYSNETENDVVTSGVYTMTRFLEDYKHYNDNLPLGKEYYMQSANSSHQQLYRISYDPNPTHNQTYIDIGVYEYPHTELRWTTEGDEVDILWVSAAEKPENGLPEGSDWTQPTSDLQRAIETLLSSRNGHRKEIRLMDGTFAPIYTIEDHLSFYFDTKLMNQSVMMPIKYKIDSNGNLIKDTFGNPIEDGVVEGLGIKSFTIKGGYSSDLYNQYDVDRYPAVFRGQRRTNATADTWDHLFYINDATQRYGYKVEDDQRYGYGNSFGWQGRGDNAAVKYPSLIPIEIDGVTFINDQALNGRKGAAIYYADQRFKTISVSAGVNDIVRDDNGDIKAIAPQPAAVRNITQYYQDEAKTIKSDVPTMYFTADLTTPYYTVENPAKFVMSKSKVMASGTKDYITTSAVYIGKEGGEAIFYNNVFHSNYGDPLYAYAAKLVNNTVAKNGGTLKAFDYQGKNNKAEDTNYTSLAYNNVFWENGATFDGVRKQFEFTDLYNAKFDGLNYDRLASVGSFFKRNAFSSSDSKFYSLTDYQVGADLDTKQHYNVGLVSDNDDVINGPNFIDPNNVDREARDFSINPSLRLLNKGDDALYTDGVSHDADKTMTYSYSSDNLIYDYAWLTTLNHDAASNKRRVFQIDLGAYEYQNKLERIIYVNPNTPETGTGTTWASPIGLGNLQSAIDLAGVYAVNNESEVAYVFVKGANLDNSTLHTGETITLRNGVQIYGGINPLKSNDVEKETINEVEDYTDATIAAYIEELEAERLGVADMNGFKTNISGIRTSSATRFNPAGDDRQTIVDGFVVTPDGAPKASALNITPNPGAKVAVRNVIVHGFNLSDDPSLNGTNVADINNALLYEALFRDNTPYTGNPVLNMGANGWGVNLTVEGLTNGTVGNIHNSIINWASNDNTFKTFSGYSYPLEDKNLNYQLAEGSKNIDACAATVPTLPESLQGFIDYTKDRDLLGNPRLLVDVSGKNLIDRGAFETWKVEQNTICNTTSTDYYGNKYPHAGSVVYITEGKSLVSAHDLYPGYLLVQKGASLYGNGFDVKAAYVAVERNVKAEGNILSLPYSMDYYNNVDIPSYNDGVLTLEHNNGQYSSYNGNERADWKYNFQDSKSPCWDPSTMPINANNAVLYVPGLDKPVLRFTGKGETMTDYIYTETGVSKTVELTQYNDGGRDTHENGNTDDNADFTDKDDMGWNAIGLPYLVSEYKTYDKVSVVGSSVALMPSTDPNYNKAPYMMHIPHTMWLFYDGKKFADGTNMVPGEDGAGNGGFYAVNSWEQSDDLSTDNPWHVSTPKEQAIWVGEGFFTQTATLESSETLTFFRPIAPALGGGGSVKTERWYMTDEIRDIEETVCAHIIGTRYYTPDGIQYSKPRKGVTIAVDIYSDGTQKSRKYMKTK